MRQVLIDGTGARARIPGYDLAGKTGTTSDYRDAWFVGFTGGFTTAVWTGRDDDTPMKRVTGGSSPAEIWRAFMAASLPRLNVQAIPGGPVQPDAIGDLLGQTGGESGAAAQSPAAVQAPDETEPPPG
jgi:penicillin-binding protein 1A